MANARARDVPRRHARVRAFRAGRRLAHARLNSSIAALGRDSPSRNPRSRSKRRADGTSPAGSGGANNPALIGEVPEARRRGCPTARRISPGSGSAAVPSATSARGLLPGEEIVLLPAAKALMDSRMAADDPEARCLPTGVPRVAPYPWRIVQTPAFGKATHLFFLFEGNIHSFRQIFMDGREHPDDLEATWYGHSVGHWEGDTLVIETVGFNELFWFDFVGHPHTTQLRTVERYTRTKFGELENVTTIYDAGAYAKPFTVKYTARCVPVGSSWNTSATRTTRTSSTSRVRPDFDLSL